MAFLNSFFYVYQRVNRPVFPWKNSKKSSAIHLKVATKLVASTLIAAVKATNCEAYAGPAGCKEKFLLTEGWNIPIRFPKTQNPWEYSICYIAMILPWYSICYIANGTGNIMSMTIPPCLRLPSPSPGHTWATGTWAKGITVGHHSWIMLGLTNHDPHKNMMGIMGIVGIHYSKPGSWEIKMGECSLPQGSCTTHERLNAQNCQKYWFGWIWNFDPTPNWASNHFEPRTNRLMTCPSNLGHTRSYQPSL